MDSSTNLSFLPLLLFLNALYKNILELVNNPLTEVVELSTKEDFNATDTLVNVTNYMCATTKACYNIFLVKQ